MGCGVWGNGVWGIWDNGVWGNGVMGCGVWDNGVWGAWGNGVWGMEYGVWGLYCAEYAEGSAGHYNSTYMQELWGLGQNYAQKGLSGLQS